MTNTLKAIFVIMLIVTVGSIVTAVRLNKKLVEAKTASTQQVTADEQIKKIISDVGQHIVLPADEVPTMAVVSDLSKLAGQPFFERAQVGDVVLIYANSRRAVLWRPSAQKIIEVSAINFPSTVGQAISTGVKTATPAPTPAKK